jgi:hypothetical protein
MQRRNKQLLSAIHAASDQQRLDGISSGLRSTAAAPNVAALRQPIPRLTAASSSLTQATGDTNHRVDALKRPRSTKETEPARGTAKSHRAEQPSSAPSRSSSAAERASPGTKGGGAAVALRAADCFAMPAPRARQPTEQTSSSATRSNGSISSAAADAQDSIRPAAAAAVVLRPQENDGGQVDTSRRLTAFLLEDDD